MMEWLAGLPVSTVAINAMLPGLVLCTCETAGWSEKGREELLLAIVPIVAWAVARWWVDRQRPRADGHLGS